MSYGLIERFGSNRTDFTDIKRERKFFESFLYGARRLIIESQSQKPEYWSHIKSVLSGQEICLFFMEESERTWLQFRTAAQELGAFVLDRNKPTFSSFKKSSDLRSLINTLSMYCAVPRCKAIVIRYHGPDTNAVSVLARQIREECDWGGVFISAGEHYSDWDGQAGAIFQPVQTMTDVLNAYLYAPPGFMDGCLKYAIVGDLGSYAVSNFVRIISLFGAETIYFVGNKWGLPAELVSWVVEKGIRIEVVNDLATIAMEVDVFYFTQGNPQGARNSFLSKQGQIQAEREYKSFVVDAAFLQQVSEEAIFLHPEPTGMEFPWAICGQDKRFKIGQRVFLNGVYAKQWLLMRCLDVQGPGLVRNFIE